MKTRKKIMTFALGGLIIFSPKLAYANEYQYIDDSSIVQEVEYNYVEIEAYSQLLISHQTISNSTGSWNTTFNTVGSAQGNRMNIFFDNYSNSGADVVVERRTLLGWSNVASFRVSANSSATRQLTSINLNTEHRITISGVGGAAVSGEVAIRQTANPL